MAKITTTKFDFSAILAIPDFWPPVGSFTIGFDTADDKLKKLDSAGVLTIIGDGEGPWESGSGNNSAQLTGSGSQANGLNSVAQNDLTEANGDNSTSMGSGSIANGDNSLAAGYLTQTDGNNSATFGKNSLAIRENEIVIGTTQFDSIGDAQNAKYVLSGTTVGTGFVVLSSDLSLNKSYNLTCKLIGRTINISEPNQQTLSVNFEGLIQFGSTLDSGSIVFNQTGYWATGNTWNGVTSVYRNGDPNAIVLSINPTLPHLWLTITGESGKNIRWVATFELTEVGTIATY